MQRIAAEVGFSETAFVVGEPRPGAYEVRYFSPRHEVPFCGHATVATGVALAECDGPGDVVFRTASGEVGVRTTFHAGEAAATLTSVVPSVRELDAREVDAALALLRWSREDLDPALPPRVAYAGAHHLVLAAATRERLADLDYDVDGLAAWMRGHDLTTVALVHREAELRFAARNPFPVGGVVEDPATGAAALALGAYLRELGAVTPPARIEVLQGDDLGRPSRLLVELDEGRPEVRVTGQAVRLDP